MRSTRTRLALVFLVSARARTRLAMRAGSETLWRTELCAVATVLFCRRPPGDSWARRPRVTSRSGADLAGRFLVAAKRFAQAAGPNRGVLDVLSW